MLLHAVLLPKGLIPPCRSMGVAFGLGSLAYLLQLVVPEKLRAPVVEIHVEGAVGRVSPPLRDRSHPATPVRRAMVRPDPHPLADLHLFGKHVGSSFSFGLLSPGMPAILPRERRPEPQLSLPRVSSQRKNPNPPRVLQEGGEGFGVLRHGYCYTSRQRCMYRVAHSALKHRLGANECGSVYYQASRSRALLCSERSVRSFCGRRLWRGPSAAEVASLGWLLGARCVRCWIWTSEKTPSTHSGE